MDAPDGIVIVIIRLWNVVTDTLATRGVRIVLANQSVITTGDLIPAPRVRDQRGNRH